MEPSKISDECSSSESGWTTYLASPIHDDNNYVNDDDENEDEDQIGTHKQANIDENEDKSDDSMASDASSGPSQIEVSYGRSKKSNLFGQNKSKTFSSKKHSEQTQKVETFRAEKEITRGNAYTPTCYSKTAAKVKKTKKMGKK